MCEGASRLAVAAFRGVGVDARLCPEADPKTLEAASRHASGDECFPQRVTLAELLGAMAEGDFDPGRSAFLMASAEGPCRFGQYAPFFRRVLRGMGCADVAVVSPSCEDGYRALGEHGSELQRLLWWAVLASDVLRGLLHCVRPYERSPGDADRAYDWGLVEVGAALEAPARPPERLLAVRRALERARDRLRSVPVEVSEPRLQIGVVGEIYCRLSTYTNEDLIRKLEGLGGEARLSGIGEWVWYVNLWERRELARRGRRLSAAMLRAWLSDWVQGRDERRVLGGLNGDRLGYEALGEVGEVLELARPYLPWEGALGEMVLSVGKAVQLHRHGADGVIDVSPFGCMNGVVAEAVYPAVSRDHGGIPIRVFYFDGTTNGVEDDLEIFMELAAAYRRRRLSTGKDRLDGITGSTG